MDDARWNEVLSGLRRGPPSLEKRDGRPIIFYRTPWERLDDGWAIAARVYARAMERAGIDVRLSSWLPPGGEPIDPAVLNEVGHMRRMPPSWDVHLFSCTLGGASDLVPLLRNMATQNDGPQAYHCVFERQTIEPTLAEALNGLHGIWAQCSANYDVLRRHGVDNVTLIHHPWFDEDPHLALDPPKECRRFYWIGRVEPRKAPDKLVRAFIRAFKPGEAELTLKLSKYDHVVAYPTPEDVLVDELPLNGWTEANWRDSIHVIRGRLSNDEMIELHAKNDVYVSASRGEGLDLPAFAAKLSGRVLVLTDSGGPRDFVNDGDVLVGSCGLVPAAVEYPWGEGATYFDHRLEDLIVGMQSVRGKRPTGSRVPSELHVDRVSRSFRGWIESLRGA